MDNISVGFVPLPELGAGTYLGAEGGLYPGASNVPPGAHLEAGRARLAGLGPRNAAGQPDPAGKIGILTLGMSNAEQVFGLLGELMDGLWAPGVVYVQGAQATMDARIWADRSSAAWTTALARVAAAGLTPAQVQVVLNFHAVAHSNTPPQPWPGTPGDLQAFAETIAGHLVSTFPHAALSFWGTREYGGYVTGQNNPEPYAYRSGFAIKWMIEKQLSGAGLNFDPTRGPVVAPWMAWGPYLWADGLRVRADGLAWEPRDFLGDGTHPNTRGRAKQALAWISFLRRHELVAPWAVPGGNLAPVCAVVAPEDATATRVGPQVALEAVAEDGDGVITQVDFHVGGVLVGSDATAPYSLLWTHPGPGDYVVTAMAWDNAGTARTSRPVLARLRAPAAPTATLAEDSFESGDLLGGGGWSGPWMPAGAVSIGAGGAADGQWSATLGGGANLGRLLNLPSTAGARLRLAWRGVVPAGGSFVIEARDSAWQTLFQAGPGTAASWTRLDLPLDGLQAAAGFGVRFRATGAGANVGLDDVRLESPAGAAGEGPPELTLAGLTGPGPGLALRWVATPGRTYRVSASPDLVAWTPIYETTATEASTFQFLLPVAAPQVFGRVEDLDPPAP